MASKGGFRYFTYDLSVIDGIVAPGRPEAACGQQGEPGARAACETLMAPPAPRRPRRVAALQALDRQHSKLGRPTSGGASSRQPCSMNVGGQLALEKAPPQREVHDGGLYSTGSMYDTPTGQGIDKLGAPRIRHDA